MMEPILKGPAGYDCLGAAFSSRHGHPSDALTVLPAAVQWLSSLRNGVDQEWNEHTTSLSLLLSQESLSQGYTPPTTLRTGGSFLVNTNGNQTSHLHGDSGDKTGIVAKLAAILFDVAGCENFAVFEISCLCTRESNPGV